MRDHRFMDDLTGQVTAISDMPTPMIHQHLEQGTFGMRVDPSAGVSAEDILERLRIELLIRSMEGRL